MSTPFLHAFTTAVLARLHEASLIELHEGRQGQVITDVAAALASVHRASLISTLAEALVASEGVDELWADNDDLKRIIDELGQP